MRYPNSHIQGDESTAEVTRDHAGSMPSLFPSSELSFPAFLPDKSLLLPRAQLRAGAGLSGPCILSLSLDNLICSTAAALPHILFSSNPPPALAVLLTSDSSSHFPPLSPTRYPLSSSTSKPACPKPE